MTDIEWNVDSRALAALMGDISEDCYCAGWMSGLEYDLWGMVVGDRTADYGMGDVAKYLDDLRTLSDRISGWIVWQEGSRDDWSDEAWRRIVPLDEWQRMYDVKRPTILEWERKRNDPEEQRKADKRMQKLFGWLETETA